MDAKTLEYMRDRVNKSQAIVNKIGELNADIKRLAEINFINFYTGSSNQFSIDARGGNQKLTEWRIIKDIKEATAKIMSDEIKTLEAELAEL